ncbi:ABC transporter permease [Candidatus Berkiella aquae]|uniref:ABC transporter permease n=1 Tax=Candidatus Berkiella aquae TaxID=295108 RepID=A0A0Q9YZH9_9GAMM|nr:ABC transporter permease [Candidatus Berkiella aquae]MCS5712363.1 ABC transporter permease [Candidatus Berkiella aquae]
MWVRIKALIIKELLAMLRDKRGRFTLIIPPLIQLFILAQAITLEVKNISVVYYNQDAGWYSRELIERVKGSPYFTHVYSVDNLHHFQKIIDDQNALVGIEIKNDFSAELAKGNNPSIGIILDGRRSNAAQIVQGYLLRIIENFNVDIQTQLNTFTPLLVQGIFRSWFNPNLDYLLYTVPCLVGILSMMLGLLVTALSVAREREMGNFDQLLVSPLQTWEIIIGKMLPAMIIGVSESTIIMIIAMILYKIPFHGSLLLFYFSMIVFITSIIGVGLFISSISQTQQQAVLGSFVFMVPTMLLSGFATPIENMPTWLQPVSWFIPITHFFIIIKGVFLKDMNATEIMINAWPMAFIAVITLSVAGWMFKRRLE